MHWQQGASIHQADRIMSSVCCKKQKHTCACAIASRHSVRTHHCVKELSNVSNLLMFSISESNVESSPRWWG
jgi:hypothetical protein